MRATIPRTCVFLALLALAASRTHSQTPQSPGSAGDQTAPAKNPTSAAPSGPTIKVTTRLIQLSVIAHDKHGKPITGLKKEDFTILDNRTPQRIAFFSASTPAHAAQPPLPANFFTNRPELKGEDPSATVVVLFDSLNTAFEDQSFARKQLQRFLHMVKPQDRVALFALTTELIQLHGFTEDAQALENSIERFSPRLLAAFDASHPAPFDASGVQDDMFFQGFRQRVNNANDMIADMRLAERIGITYGAFVALTNYVEKAPGRKSLVWVTGGFPIEVGVGRVGIPDRENFSWTGTGIPGIPAGENMDTLTRALNRVNMAVYPIDVSGIDTNDSALAFFSRQSVRDTFRLMADETGGKAFYGTNDVAGAIESAFEDGRYTYTMGFYPDHNEWNGKFRKIKVAVNLDGAHLRYRRGYFAQPEKPDTGVVLKEDLLDAAKSPLDSTELGLSVKSKAVPGTSEHALQLQVMLDVKDFWLREENGRRKGALDLLFLQSDASGRFLSAQKQHMEMSISKKEYEERESVAMTVQKRLKVESGTVALRVLARDSGSGALGSVTIAVEKIANTN